MSQYKVLSRAQLSYDYLHTNSTTHEFLFGALAELLDNARDASATKINIYTVPDEEFRGGYLLCFLDDGEGMDQGEAADIITFGRSVKKTTQDSQMIGMYGNGLKSGSMRIGNDFIMFTKKGQTMTCVFLSRTFHEEEGIDEIVVPMPSFDSQSKKPITRTPKEKEKHRLEMDLILKYSPFRTEAQFMKEFDKIEGSSGTLVIVYNQKLLDNHEPELDVKRDPYDIILAHPDGNEFDSDDGHGPRLMPERKSFRAYASILYVDPRMRIYIQGKKVRTKRLANCLFKPRYYKYSSVRFKNRAELETMKAKEESKMAENRAKEAESKARSLEAKGSNSKESRADLRKAQTSALELRKDAQLKKQISDRKLKSLREPKTLNFIFGININDRNQDGMFVYNCSRLIKMYQKVGPQADGGVFCSGVVGVVDVPYLVLEPTHNKQDFADAKEYRHLQRAMGEHVVQYWKDISIAQQGVTKFWENFGYISPNWRDPPSHDAKFIRKRAMQIQITLQCDLCLKWRMLPFSANNIGKTFPDDWVCSMNPDPAHNRCSAPEQKLNITEGVLKKETKSREQREKDLEEDIKKKQEQLKSIQKHKPILSSKQVREMEEAAEEEEEEEEEELPVRSKREPDRSSHHKKSNDHRSSSHKSHKKQKRSISRAHVATDTEDDEFIDDEEPPPPKKKAQPKPAPKPQPKPQPRSKFSTRTGVLEKLANRRMSRSSQDDDDDNLDSMELEIEDVRTNRRRRGSGDDDRDRKSRKSRNDTMDTTEPDDGSRSEDAETDIGTKVEVKSQGKWLRGTITESNHKQQRWKVKFDKHPQGRHDKWFDKKSSDLRVISASEAQAASTTTSLAGGSSPAHDGSATEAPSSSTAGATATAASNTEDIANGYRTCLRYFLPPQWAMDKEAVSTLTIQELAGFPLDDFFDHYEKGLRKLVSSFQLEAQTRQHEAEQIRTKLSSVRKMIAKLLKSINEEFDIDPECDNDQVDELLALCVKQATQQLGEEK